MNQSAQRPERKRIVDDVRNGSSTVGFRESMRVTPEFIWSFGLDVDKFVRRIPALNFREPSEWNAADAQRIGDGRSRMHLNGPRGEYPEMHPGWSNSFQIFGAREKVEDFLERTRDPQFTLEFVGGHNERPWADRDSQRRCVAAFRGTSVRESEPADTNTPAQSTRAVRTLRSAGSRWKSHPVPRGTPARLVPELSFRRTIGDACRARTIPRARNPACFQGTAFRDRAGRGASRRRLS